MRDPSVPPRFIEGRGTYYVPRLLVQSIDSGESSFVAQRHETHVVQLPK